MTRPFAPKEFDDGSYTQTRDLHAFAVVALCCLHKGDITTYPEVEGALQQVELPAEIRELLTLSLSDLPEVRPANAGVLLARIEPVAGRPSRCMGGSRDSCTLANQKGRKQS